MLFAVFGSNQILYQLEGARVTRIWPGFWRDIMLNGIVASVVIPRPARWRLLRIAGLQVDRCRVSPKVWFGGRNIEIGSGSFVNYGCRFDSTDWIRIGKRCSIGPDVSFLTSTHLVGASSQRAGSSQAQPISVGDGCWIGARVTILPGVTIEAGCVIAAGTVVVNSCAANGLYAGVPARRIRDLGE